MIIPRPRYEEPVEVVIEKENYERIRKFLDCPNWKCVKCNTTMMGRVEKCTRCKEKRP